MDLLATSSSSSSKAGTAARSLPSNPAPNPTAALLHASTSSPAEIGIGGHGGQGGGSGHFILPTHVLTCLRAVASLLNPSAHQSHQGTGSLAESFMLGLPSVVEDPFGGGEILTDKVGLPFPKGLNSRKKFLHECQAVFSPYTC